MPHKKFFTGDNYIISFDTMQLDKKLNQFNVIYNGKCTGHVANKPIKADVLDCGNDKILNFEFCE